jgi:hypothetical protein
MFCLVLSTWHDALIIHREQSVHSCTTFDSLRVASLCVTITMCLRGVHMYDVLTGYVVAGEMGSAAGGQVPPEEGLPAFPSALLPSEPWRPPMAADVVPGKYLAFLPILLLAASHAARWTVDCRLVVVMGWDYRLSTAALGLLYYPQVIAMWTSA